MLDQHPITELYPHAPTPVYVVSPGPYSKDEPGTVVTLPVELWESEVCSLRFHLGFITASWG